MLPSIKDAVRKAAGSRGRAFQFFKMVVGIVVLYLLLHQFFPAPPGILVEGVIAGGLTALTAFGMILIYRANRVINFAQADMGTLPAVLVVCLMNWRPGGAVSYLPSSGQGILNFWLAVPLAIVAAIFLGWAVEWLLIRRFRKAPRLIVMVVTIGLATILETLASSLPGLFKFQIPPNNFPNPFNFNLSISGVIFHANDVITLVTVVVLSTALFAFLRYTNIGVAIRACAESSDRASLLGINVGRTQSIVWIIAAVLSTVATLLRAGIIGIPIGTAFGPELLVQALAAAVIARMENYRVAFIAAAGIGVLQESILWHTGSTTLLDPVLFVVVLAALLLQRKQKTSRLEDQSVSSWRDTNEVRPIPRELASLPEVRWTLRAFKAIFVFGLIGLPFVIGASWQSLVSALFIYVIVALSLVILTGWAGEISLGQIGIFAIGSVVCAVLNVHYRWDPLITIALAGIAGAIVALLIGLPALRVRGLFLTVTTLSFALAVASFLANRPLTYLSFLPGPISTDVARLPLFGEIKIASEQSFYYFSLAILAMVFFAVRGLQRSRTARVLIASRDNERAAQAFGISVTRARLTAFALSGLLAGLAGGLFALHENSLGTDAYQGTQSLILLSMVVVGGLGSIPGALLGTFFVLATTWFSPLVPAAVRYLFTLAGSGVGLIFVLLMLRGGLGSLMYRIRDRLLRFAANRRHIIVPSLIADVGRPRHTEVESMVEVAEADAVMTPVETFLLDTAVMDGDGTADPLEPAVPVVPGETQ